MEFKQGRALIIGVANYEEALSLPNAVLNDAHDTADVLRASAFCGYPDEHVTILTDKQATLDGMRKALADLASAATVDDTIAIFFSGHGARLGKGAAATSALIPYDCKLSDMAGTTFGEVELSSALGAIKAARLLVIIDACHAGGAATLKSELQGGLLEGFSEKSLQQLATGTGRVVLASSRAGETSIILKGARNSVFTTAILDGLRGAAPIATDGTIKVFDLFNYVSEAVRQAVPGRQHPIFKASELEENFPVALALGGAKAPGASGAIGNRHRDLEQILPDLFPVGPTDQEIWFRAGGDISRLKLGGNGRAQWFAALRTLSQGGGGADITRQTLIAAALEEFPHHQELQRLIWD